MEAKFIGIEIGGSKLQLVLGDESAKILERRKFSVDRTAGADGIRRQIETTLPELARGKNISAVGVGFGGPVDWETGKIARSHQIEGWSEFQLVDWLRKFTAAPIFTDNDQNVAALAEATHGAGVGFDPVFFITLGSGIGGGLILNGKIYHGAKPGEAEIGHVRLDRDGTTLESRCSGWAIDARIRGLKIKEPDSVLAKLAVNTTSGEARFLLPALQQGDAPAKKILQELAGDLAFGLSHAVHLFHPQVIVIGGGLSAIGEPLRSAVESSLGKFLMEVFLPGPKILLAKLGEDVVPVGVLELARLGWNRRPAC